MLLVLHKDCQASCKSWKLLIGQERALSIASKGAKGRKSLTFDQLKMIADFAQHCECRQHNAVGAPHAFTHTSLHAQNQHGPQISQRAVTAAA